MEHPRLSYGLTILSGAVLTSTAWVMLLPLASWTQAQTLERVDPPSPELPLDPPPEAPDLPEELLPTPPAELPSGLPAEVLTAEIEVTELKFNGTTLLNKETLQQAIQNALTQGFGIIDSDEFTCEPPSRTPVWTPLTQTVSQLLRFAEVVAACYAAEGYTTSGALVDISKVTADGVGPVNINVIEGELVSVDIMGLQRLNEGYVRSRLNATLGEPLNVDQLQESLQLLQIDPLIQQVRADLNAGADPGNSRLEVTLKEARSFNTSLALDNSRPPSVGTVQGQLFAREANLLGIGDSISVGYTNSEGSDALSFGYSVLLNADDGKLSFRFDPTWNDIVDSDFFDINRDGEGPDIESRSQLYELSYRQPIVRKIKDQTFQELAIGLSSTLRNSQSFFLDEPLPLGPGASADGKTRVFVLRFFQDYTRRDRRQILTARSQFNVGLDFLDSTVNSFVEGVGSIPDSRFFSWQGQAQWTRVLAPETLFLLRSSLQLADQELLSSEQFSIGGVRTVRGYRQDQLLTDNGFTASAEARIPLIRFPEWDGLVQVAPFIDFGTGWNSGDNNDPDDNTLAAVGLGL
ncbi:MAG: ShlB/FhaC/HecB family hemolysin secretion/activation protein, partial [Symploca sp. SIO2G7]|nr:ShlB/FhaC/HecB family hemolysin secretion/activation protein [Symploca sp. SIO2G7]